ncbi:MAG: RNA polymerase factor sigma-54 [Saprospiraceae bacterium]
MLRQSLSQKMMQKLSPQQIQLMKLLQIPTATLDQRIKEELEANPALDEGEENNEVFDLENNEEEGESTEEFELDDYIKEYIEEDPISYKLKGDVYSTEEDKNIPIAVHDSFHEQLEAQIGMLELDNTEESIIKQIVGSIDHDGYLRREPSSIIDDLMFGQNITTDVETVEKLLSMVHKFEPAGVGARDLKECLLLQLEFKIKKESCTNVESKTLALKILVTYFNEFTKKHYQKLTKYLNVNDEQLKSAIDEILKLNPKPASGVSGPVNNSQYVIPDFIILNRDGELELTLNSKNAPDLRINDQYMDMLKGYNDNTKGRRTSKQEKAAVMFIKQKIDGAKWFIDAIKQRQDTLYRTMYSIMQYQYAFFTTGDNRVLKPMILKDIAEITGLDISTVSRVANSKYVQTEFGTKKLKGFFSESLITQDGKEVSTLEVKNVLTEVVAGESKKKPLSDEKLKESLTKRGYNIARRTVAKYREQLNIPVARLRKEL